MKSPPRSYLQVGIAASALGLWPVFLRPARIPPTWSAVIVLCVVGVVVAALLFFRSVPIPTQREHRQCSDWVSVFLLGVCASANALLYFTALNTTKVAVAVLSHCLVPVFVTVTAPWVLGTPRQTRSVVLSIIALAGLALMLEPWRFGTSPASNAVIGLALGGSAAAFNSGYLLISKRIAHRFTAEEQIVYQTLFALPLLFAVLMTFPPPPPTLSGVIRVAAGAATVGVLGGLLLLRGLRYVPAEHAGFVTLLEPITAAFVAWVVWNERLGMLGLLGAAIVIVSGVIALRSTESSPATVLVHSSAGDPVERGGGSGSAVRRS